MPYFSGTKRTGRHGDIEELSIEECQPAKLNKELLQLPDRGGFAMVPARPGWEEEPK